MAKIYFNRVVLGSITFDKVPAKYQDAVMEIAKEYVAAGKMTEKEFNRLFK